MGFSHRRGRPKKIIVGKDKGTAELIEKRKAGITFEPLDICFNKGLIDAEQHNAGIRIRWLYTLKFGAPTISSYSPDNVGGHSCKYEDFRWLERRQREYNRVILELDRLAVRQIIMDICVFGHVPGFLHTTPDCAASRGLAHHRQLTHFINGLDAINILLKCK